MEAAGYSAISATTYQTTRSHIQECSNSAVNLMLIKTRSPAKTIALLPLVLLRLGGK
jgi:hypothetical protein